MRVLFCIALLLVVKGAVIVTCPQSGLGCVTIGATTIIQSTRTNSLCNNGYYWNNQACMPCKIIAHGYYTCSAYYGATSLICSSNYTLINGVCVPNPVGCTAYGLNSNSDAYVCTACTSDYTLKAGVCINNRYCSSWDDNAVCTTCSTGYYINWDLKFTSTSQNTSNQQAWLNTWQTYYTFPGESFCSACSQTMANCKSCNSAYTCSQCNDGYYWQQSISSTQLTSSNAQFAGSCVSCLQSGFCSACQGSTCTQCISGYYPSKDTTNSVILSCNKCPNGCSSCTSSTVCTDCYALYYKYTDNLCYPLNLCASINTSLTTTATNPKCSSCVAGYALDSSQTGICYKCGNCDTFKQKIYNKYILYQNIINSFIIINLSLYQTTCSCTVPSGQQTASPSTSCTTCWDTYYGIKDANGIVTCQLCTQASDSFLRCQGPVENSSLTGVVPTQCQDGYYLYTLPAQGTGQAQVVCVPSNQALQCVTIVATSANQYTCATCILDYIIYIQINNKSQIDYTTQTQLFNNSLCQACNAGLTTSLPQGCTACSGSPSGTIACSACAVNYFFSSGTTTTCTACDVNCIQCSAGPTCSKCATTYYVTGSGCTQCGVTNCATCNAQSPNTCQVCLDGYFLSSINTGTATNSYCLQCPPECLTCSAPGQVCNSCYSGYVLTNGGCISLSSANCADGYTASTLNNQQYPATQNGCAICRYGFYNFEKRCLQSVQPYAGAAYIPSNIGIGSNPGVSNYQTIMYSIFLVIMLLGY